MFDFAWTQIGLVGVVALILIGPKDLPIAIRAVAGFVKKARRMAGEFQTHVDEMVKDTELADLKNQISELRNFDIRREVERAVDYDGTLRANFDMPDALANKPASIVTGGVAADDVVEPVVITPHETPPVAQGAPAFVPPAFVPPAVVQPEAAVPVVEAAPAFIPPAAATRD